MSRRFTEAEIAEVWERRRAGELTRSIARRLGRNGSSIRRLFEDWSWVDSFYFSTVAVTTVGFGDFAPTTDTSKLFTVLYIVAGIALIGTYLDVALRRRATKIAGRRP